MLFHDQYSGKEDFRWGFDSNSGEKETDYNWHHTLVPDMVTDDNDYITYGSSAGPENGDGSKKCQAGAVNEHCTPSLREEVRERSGRAGERDTQHWEGGVAAHVRFTDHYWQVRK